MRRRRFLSLSVAGLAATRAISIRGFAAAARADEVQQRLGDLLIHRPTSDRYTVRFTPGKPRPLRILQLTDTHFHPSATTARTEALISGLVERERPDLVVHTGDFVNNDSSGRVEWRGLEFMNDLPVPWTLCFGNHDYPVHKAEGSLALDAIHARIARGLQGHHDSPAGRHYCWRYDLFAGDAPRPAATLCFFQVGYAAGDRRISAPQLDWFDGGMRADAERGDASPVTVFVHIPLKEYAALHASGRTEGVKGEKICFDSDTGESFRRFAGSKRVTSVFCGHDHVNNYHGDWHGTDLVYGRVSGWGGYGPGTWQRGGRLIELDLAEKRPVARHREVF